MSAEATSVASGEEPGTVTVSVPLVTQLFRFICTGVVGAVVDFGSTYLLSLVGLSHAGSKTVGFILGTLTAYFINRRWTFQAAPSRKRFVATMCSYLLTYLVQLGLFLVCIPWLEDHGFSDFWTQAISFVIAQGTATVLNFIIQRWVIFRVV
ncbi:MAG: GtrA family protein [Corynebacterium variabile]|uniref:GtrA family protein n=1 Tax=Corynebacterium variabile TaxID=1727 RepID=UPI002648D283|nr:GtrA family protein [Corynebacterium variabile]MDN6478200.1 GtrA family protein [Corynebacterium variabile]MDN6619086.1 GtrA family protein [Corynebacterium variabile]MDN6814079.1 GtrA family protein [Corynebacterium variabile]MDN6844626.1 GtrA family protein [Corynebacterium variabile]